MLLKVFVQISYLAVVLRMIRAGERFVNTQQPAHFQVCFRGNDHSGALGFALGLHLAHVRHRSQ